MEYKKLNTDGLTSADREILYGVKKKIDKHRASQVHGTGGMKPYEPENDSERRIMNYLNKKNKESSKWKPKQLTKDFDYYK